MLTFRNLEKKEIIEDHFFNMYRTTLEVETQINAVISMDYLVHEFDITSSQIDGMIFHHHSLALIHAAFVLKKNKGDDEVHTLCNLRKWLIGLEVNLDKNSIKPAVDNIVSFYKDYDLEITKITNNRNAEAHFFVLDKRIETSKDNEISFNKQLEIILKARKLISDLYTALFEKDLANEFEYEGKYDVHIYEKIYSNGLKSLE